MVVAHNAPFDTGFLRRACEGLGYPYPRWPVLDTAALARVDPAARRGAELQARHARPALPDDRDAQPPALTDAQATVDVLHGLMERVGNLGVHTLEDLQEFSRQVSPQRRSRRTWAAGLPETAGRLPLRGRAARDADGEAQRHVLYVGKSKNLRAARPDVLHRVGEAAADGRDGPAWPPASRRSSATPSSRPTCWSCG